MFSSPRQLLYISLLTLVLTGHVTAQPAERIDPGLDSLSRYTQMKYGLDQELFNGLQYYQRYIHYMGDPFFPGDAFYKGSISLRGIEYVDVYLKYDCYAQDLILEYTDFQDRYNQLILDSVHIDSFRLGSYRFQKLSLSGEEPVFYQILQAGPVTCYVHWKKNLVSLSYNFQFTHEFTDPNGTFFFRYRGQIHPVASRNQYIAIFPDSLKRKIRRYFSRQRFSFRKPDLSEIQSMLHFIVSHEEIENEL